MHDSINYFKDMQKSVFFLSLYEFLNPFSFLTSQFLLRFLLFKAFIVPKACVFTHMSINSHDSE